MIEKIKKVIPIIFAFAVVSGSCTAFAADIPIYEWEQETPYIEEQTTEDSKESAGLTEMSYAEEQIQEQVWEDFQDVYHEEVPEQLQEEMPEQNQEEVPGQLQEEMPEQNQEEVPEQLQEEMPEQNQEEGPEQLQEETPEQYTATGEGTNDYTDLSEVGFQSTTVKQMSQLPLEIKLETQDTIPAWTMYKEVVEIRNITTLYMNNIDLKLKCTDYGLNITPFKNTDDAQYELSTVNIFDEQGCLKPEYAERTLRISSLAPGESIKAEIVLWAYWDITPDEQGFNASAQVEFSEGTDRVSAQGKWKVAKPEKTEIKEPTEALQEAEVYDQQIDEVEINERTEALQEAEVYDQQIDEVEMNEQTEMQAQESDMEIYEPEPEIIYAETNNEEITWEDDDYSSTEEISITGEIPFHIAISDYEEEVQEARQDENESENEMITIDLIGDEDSETGEDEYMQDYYYDDGSYYYDDWGWYEGVDSSQQISTSTPYLLVKSYSHKKTVNTGEPFGMEITLLNTSQQLGIENILIKVETSEGLSLVNGTNTLFVNDMPAGGTTTQMINLRTAAECKDSSQNVSLSITFEYVENKERKQGQASESISIPVSQQDRLEIREPSYDYMEAGREGVISISYVNKGFSSLYNMEASLELENAGALQNVVYAGNVESGKSGTLDFVVTPYEDGEYTGEVTLKYENSSQKEELVKIPLNFTSTMAYVADDFYYDDAADETGADQDAALSPVLMAGAGGLAVALAVLAAVLIVRKKKKSRKEEEEDLGDWFQAG